eukprot:gene7259-biopygen19534
MCATSRVRGIMALSSAEGRRPLASEWLVTVPYNERTTVYDAQYLTAIRKRLGLPVAVRGDRCRVRRAGAERAWESAARVRGRECGVPRRYRRLMRCYPRGGRDARAPRDAGTGGSIFLTVTTIPTDEPRSARTSTSPPSPQPPVQCPPATRQAE